MVIIKPFNFISKMDFGWKFKQDNKQDSQQIFYVEILSI